jgi:hypothetical protein
MDNNVIPFGSPQLSPWARISEVAAKLGVKPKQTESPPSIVAVGADGQTYDVWEVVIAFLDKMEEKA